MRRTQKSLFEPVYLFVCIWTKRAILNITFLCGDTDVFSKNNDGRCKIPGLKRQLQRKSSLFTESRIKLGWAVQKVKLDAAGNKKI